MRLSKAIRQLRFEHLEARNLLATIQGLGFLPGGSDSYALGVSADGSTIVGYGNTGDTSEEAFRWTVAGGMQPLGFLTGGHISVATSVSADGSAIVGYSYSSNNGHQAFRWTASGGMQPLGYLTGGNLSEANDVSADGSIVVGYSYTSSGQQAFRWTQSGGMQGLGVLFGTSASEATAISADGSTIVGYSGGGFSTSEAFWWNSATGLQALGYLTGDNGSEAMDVSANGSTIVGYSYSSNGLGPNVAFRWTLLQGMKSLNFLPGGASSSAAGVSADGSTIVGDGDVPVDQFYGYEAFRWTSSNGMQGLGYLPGGNIASSEATGVSADGSTIVGDSSSSHGNHEAFRLIDQQIQPPDLALALNSLPSAPDKFFWNSVETGGGFTFTYTVSNPSGTNLPNSSIDFYWQSASKKTLAYSFALDGSDDGSGKPRNATGQHIIRVVNTSLLTSAPPLSEGPTQLTAILDPDNKVAESDETNNAAAIDVVPLVVNIMTHGWDPFHTADQDWQTYANALNAIPANGSTLQNRIASYVPQWDSNTYFTEAFLELAASEIVQSSGRPGNEIESQILKLLAVLTAKDSASLATAAAQSIADTVELDYLSPPEESDRIQRIELIGHSRGAAVNALVSKILTQDGYQNIVDYVALDGFSTDWPGDASLLGDISIVDDATVSSGGEKISYRVQVGLQNLVLNEAIGWLNQKLGTNYTTTDFPLISGLATVSLGDLRAPERAGFGGPPNPIVAGVGNTASDHINISGLYFDPVEGYLDQLYEGKNANSGTLSAPPNGQFALQNIAPVGSGSGADLPDEPDLVFGFVDGAFNQLGAILSEAQSASLMPTGDALIDYFVQQANNPAAMLANIWQVSGDAKLVKSDQNYAAQLHASGGTTSISQLVNLPTGANSIQFDLLVQNATVGSTIQVLADGTVLQSIDLTTPASQHRNVVLPTTVVNSSTITFRLLSMSGATVTIDNIGLGTPGDYNQNGTVDAADYVVWRNSQGATGVVPYQGADGNGDGIVNQQDYNVWRANFSRSLVANTIPTLPGDYNRNGVVDAADYIVWKDTLGASGLTSYQGADGNGDGVVDQKDYAVWRANFGRASSASGSLAIEVSTETIRTAAAAQYSATTSAYNKLAKPLIGPLTAAALNTTEEVPPQIMSVASTFALPQFQTIPVSLYDSLEFHSHLSDQSGASLGLPLFAALNDYSNDIKYKDLLLTSRFVVTKAIDSFSDSIADHDVPAPQLADECFDALDPDVVGFSMKLKDL